MGSLKDIGPHSSKSITETMRKARSCVQVVEKSRRYSYVRMHVPINMPSGSGNVTRWARLWPGESLSATECTDRAVAAVAAVALNMLEPDRFKLEKKLIDRMLNDKGKAASRVRRALGGVYMDKPADLIMDMNATERRMLEHAALLEQRASDIRVAVSALIGRRLEAQKKKLAGFTPPQGSKEGNHASH